ncbi:hypothetical protein HMPREF1586_01226 [Gardnerella vaginalis JCP8522]|nr:hypothetical protein HMPREF1586_01226 [Gardnerella vaginalis JCP8522]
MRRRCSGWFVQTRFRTEVNTEFLFNLRNCRLVLLIQHRLQEIRLVRNIFHPHQHIQQVRRRLTVLILTRKQHHLHKVRRRKRLRQRINLLHRALASLLRSELIHHAQNRFLGIIQSTRQALQTIRILCKNILRITRHLRHTTHSPRNPRHTTRRLLSLIKNSLPLSLASLVKSNVALRRRGLHPFLRHRTARIARRIRKNQPLFFRVIVADCQPICSIRTETPNDIYTFFLDS